MRALVPALAALALLSGCLQGEQAVVIYPDGSGTFTLRMKLKRSMVRFMEEMIAKNGGTGPDGQKIENPIDVIADPARLMKQSEGIVGWTTEKPVAEGEWVAVSATGYFDDVSKVRVYDFDGQTSADGRPRLTFAGTLLRSGGTTTLVATTHLPGKIQDMEEKRAGQAGDERFNEAMADLMKPMMQDMKGSVRITAPGDVRDSRGFTKVEGRTASLEFDGAMLLKMLATPDSEEARRFRKMAVEGTSVSWTDTGVPDAEMRAFKARLESVRAKGAEARAGAASAGTGLPDVSTLSDDEVDRLFIQAQIKNAREFVRAGRKDKAREILDDVIKEYPQQKATLEARKLLAEISR